MPDRTAPQREGCVSDKADGKPKLGYLGMGLMGAPMAKRLVAAGYPVTIWNRSPGKMKPVVDAGATPADSPAAVAEAADIVMMCVTDARSVHAVVFEEDGLCAANGDGKILIDFSSIRPDLTRDYAKRLNDSSGWRWIDAPVSGGVPGAEKGTLAIMAGGEAEDIERVRPVVGHLSGRFTHMGPQGAGQVTKLVNQMIVGCNVMAIAEAISFAQRAGVDASQIPEALQGGFADSIPLQLFGPRFASRTYEPKLGELSLFIKDLDTAMDTSRQVNASVPLSSTAAQLMRMLGARGHAADDLTVLEKLFRDEAL